jgi:hypothetical protein
MNLHCQWLSHISYHLIFMLLADEPNWFRQISEQVDYGRATQLKDRSINKPPERRHVTQINAYIKRGEETCAGCLVEAVEVKE